MKWLFKWALRLVIVLTVLVVIFLLSLDSILKAALTRRIRAQTGLEAKIENLSAGVLSPTVTIENFKLYNPAEFGGGLFLHVRELHLEYDRRALGRRTVHLKLLRLDLADLAIVRNDTGRTNLALIEPKPAPAAPRPEEWIFTGADVMNLTVGKLHYTDLKNPRHNREFNPHMQNQVFKNVQTTADLYGVIIMIWLRSGGGVAETRDSIGARHLCRFAVPTRMSAEAA